MDGLFFLRINSTYDYINEDYVLEGRFLLSLLIPCYLFFSLVYPTPLFLLCLPSQSSVSLFVSPVSICLPLISSICSLISPLLCPSTHPSPRLFLLCPLVSLIPSSWSVLSDPLPPPPPLVSSHFYPPFPPSLTLSLLTSTSPLSATQAVPVAAKHWGQSILNLPQYGYEGK